jgi:membrane protein
LEQYAILMRCTIPKEILELFKDTFDAWNKDHAPRLGAALAYYTVFSLGPLLIIVIAIAGLVFGQTAARQQILTQMESLVGPQGVQFIENAIVNSNRPSTNIIFTGIGLVTLLLGALGVFGQLQDALNAIWDVTPKPGRGWKGLLQDRLLSFTMVLGTGFLLLVSLVISTAIAALVKYFGAYLPISPVTLEGINFFVSLVIITIVFALIFKYLPDAQIGWRNVWIGALLTSLLFVIGKFVLGFYLGNSQIGTIYGAAGSLLIVLLWIYYSAQILFFGAEFTKVFATRYGKGIVPAPNAVRVTEQVQA